MRTIMCNHLQNGYSNYNLLFLKRYSSELNKNSKVLDVGAGHFRNLKLFNEVGLKKLYAIDKNIPQCKFNLNVKFKLQDIENGLPYENKQMDIVLCNYVLMFIPIEKMFFVLDELLRVCKNFLIIETYPQTKKSKKTELKNYNFISILEYVSSKKNFQVLDMKKSEKFMMRRI
ncbi:class I SAM-dependent methyltransferase [Clostridium estertheticum]|uniref:class I SAM-dependent methyltransferase n=1 Tax=Clostridium estertheticum TaxID=238834 RepID=UPI001C0C280E|nr:class I SAM-dependent methyltransferase [Clostridium estertheticum]MBU3174409.1 class I SAM-dependent methyltransferase [Clostridium estertheticum]